MLPLQRTLSEGFRTFSGWLSHPNDNLRRGFVGRVHILGVTEDGVQKTVTIPEVSFLNPEEVKKLKDVLESELEGSFDPDFTEHLTGFKAFIDSVLADLEKTPADVEELAQEAQQILETNVMAHGRIVGERIIYNGHPAEYPKEYKADAEGETTAPPLSPTTPRDGHVIGSDDIDISTGDDTGDRT